MCRSIMTLRAIEHDENDVEAAALQFVRKISGYRKPSAKNEQAFNAAVQDITAITRRLLAEVGAETLPAGSFKVPAPLRNRAVSFSPQAKASATAK
jgi:hypothetical protein